MGTFLWARYPCAFQSSGCGVQGAGMGAIKKKKKSGVETPIALPAEAHCCALPEAEGPPPRLMLCPPGDCPPWA